MMIRWRRYFKGGSIDHTNADLARIMTIAHKDFMSAADKLREQMTKQQADMDSAHKYITALKPTT